MSLRSIFLGSAVALAGFAAVTSTAKDYGQWQPLFNGKNLEGWEHVGPGKIVVEDGVLKTEGGMGLLWYTKEKISNAVVRVVFRVPDPAKGGNSGVFIRIPTEPTEPWMPVNKGYEVQIDFSENDYHRTGVLYSLTKAMAKPEPQEWNTMEITLTDDRTVVTLNGEKITDYKEGDPVPEKKGQYEPDRGKRAAAGYIGLQNHDDKDVVLFRDISVKKLK
jgi:3-keto-disaccharide hydrolase